MIYLLAGIAFGLLLLAWSMCRVAAQFDENFGRLEQRERTPAQLDFTGTAEAVALYRAAPQSSPAGQATIARRSQGAQERLSGDKGLHSGGT